MASGFRLERDYWERRLTLRGWFDKDLAEHAGLSKAVVCRAINGEKVRRGTVQKMLLALARHPAPPELADLDDALKSA